MFDIICVLFLYFMFMLNLFGVEMLFIFKLATIFSLARITIRVTKFVKGTTTYKTENLEPFIEKMFKIMISTIVSNYQLNMMVTLA